MGKTSNSVAERLLELTTPARRAMENSRWLRGFGRYHREPGQPPIRARMGAGTALLVRYPQFCKPAEILIQRPSGRKPLWAWIPVGTPQSRLPHRLLSSAHPGENRLFRKGETQFSSFKTALVSSFQALHSFSFI